MACCRFDLIRILVFILILLVENENPDHNENEDPDQIKSKRQAIATNKVQFQIVESNDRNS